MKTTLITLGLSVFFIASCGSKEENKDEKKEETKKEEVTEEITKYGEEFSEEGAMTPSEFLTAFQGKDSMQVTIKGNVAEVCKKKGCWMTMDLGNDQTMRISYDYKFLMPLDCDGLPIVINGMAYVDTISVDDQIHYLKDANASDEEIAAVTEPQVNISFLAKGVILRNE